MTHLASLSNIIFIERYSTIECFIYVYVYIHRERERERKRKYVKAADKKRDQYSLTFDILKMNVAHAR